MRLLPRLGRARVRSTTHEQVDLTLARAQARRRPPRGETAVADGDLLGRLDAARERLRAEIPPRAEDD